ncbi:MAG TPA: HAD hydrolase-like protein [Candidatus Hydrogenedentes bacterium]|nr:HAD hydrolase-like protein [Candidatus Hydrogenedentota bacterium]HNT88035.1 HAD hydrolase-like protein [Candidatus Hydrogenedentota bacterium]
MTSRETRRFLPGTQIEIVNDAPLGRIKHVLFDFDGTISLLREGWQRIMAPVCIEMICGDTPVTPDVEHEVHEMIEETTGINTILQMERLVEMVRAHGRVPEDKMLDAHGYKKVYNDRLMVPVRDRIARLERGELTLDQVRVRGAVEFLELLTKQDVTMYVFSGTDRDDVRNEAHVVQVDDYFVEIWGALRTYEESSKEKIIRELMAEHNLSGPEVLAVGDGPVELRNVKEYGGIALGVATDEVKGHGWNESKRTRLLRAGADILVPDFAEAAALASYLFPQKS